MSEAAVMHAGAEPQETPLTPESWGKLGMWLFLAGDAMSFGCLIVGYGILRHANKNWPVPSQVLGINLTAFMTFLLIVSSVWMVTVPVGNTKGRQGEVPEISRTDDFGRHYFLRLPGLRVDPFDHSPVAGIRHLLLDASFRHYFFCPYRFPRACT